MDFVNVEKTVDPGTAIIHNNYLMNTFVFRRGTKVLLGSQVMSNSKIPIREVKEIFFYH